MLTRFDPSVFGMASLDFRLAGTATSGGRSLSGIEDTIRTDGGGFVIADFAGGSMVDREANLAWRAFTAKADGGATSFEVLLIDRRHQPVRKQAPAPVSAIVGSGNLRDTVLTLSFAGQKKLRGGEWFSIDHPTWGPRAYQIVEVSPSGSNFTVEFRPPLREAVANGVAVEFSYPRCKMRVASPLSNASTGRAGNAAVTFVEDMRLPPPAFEIVARVNSLVTDLGSGVFEIRKNGGTPGSYDASATSDAAYLTGDFILRLTPMQAPLGIGAGISTNPTAGTDHTDINYEFWFDGASSPSFYQGGANQGTYSNYSAGENWFIKRTGSTLSFGRGGVDGITGYTEVATRSSGAAFYFDSTITTAGKALQVARLA